MLNRIKLFIYKIIRWVKQLILFLTHGIWRVDSDGKSRRRISIYNIIKAIMLAYRNLDGSQLNTRAAALTYSTLLSIVPLLAVLFAIARGFGFQNIVKTQLFEFFAAQESALKNVMTFIDNSIEYAQGGVFLGIGVVLLLYTVVNLLSNIEDNLNRIWKIKSSRTYYRMFTDYLALIIIIPVFLVCNAGFALVLNQTQNLEVIGVIMSPIMKIVPFVVVILLFTFMFAYIPNTKVKFTSALVGGVFTGVVFLVFQYLYIGGQIWIAKYNTIYGSFAAIPLFLLWMQMSWFITLIGVQISYSYQNVSKFDFDYEISNMSRRYKDFVALLMLTVIVKRFEKEEKPYTADQISELHKIPTKLTSDTLFFLLEVGLILETPSGTPLVPAYIPGVDINRLTIGYMVSKTLHFGSEDFSIDKEETFKSEWSVIVDMEALIAKNRGDILLKDL